MKRPWSPLALSTGLFAGSRTCRSASRARYAVRMTCCSDGRSGTVMVTGLPVRGSNRVMVIRTSHNSTLSSRRAGCHVGGTLPVPGKAHLPWIVCWSCVEYGRPVILWPPMEVLGPTALQHRVVARRSRSYMLRIKQDGYGVRDHRSQAWTRGCVRAHPGALRFAREWAEQGLTGITIVNLKGESYDIDRFGMIVSTTEDGLHADQT